MTGYKVTLSDGTELTGLLLNGNNFISRTEVDEGTFAGKLGHVRIEGPVSEDDFGLIGEHENMELVQVVPYGGEWWFILRDQPEGERERLQLRSDVDYVAMMTGVEL